VADEFERAIRLIETRPEIGVRVKDIAGPSVRRLLLPRTRYYLYYRLAADDLLEVVAIWHASRGSGP
jgi:plasmid stabilization system protein ParE